MNKQGDARSRKEKEGEHGKHGDVWRSTGKHGEAGRSTKKRAETRRSRNWQEETGMSTENHGDASTEFKMEVIVYTDARWRPCVRSWCCFDIQFMMALVFAKVQCGNSIIYITYLVLFSCNLRSTSYSNDLTRLILVSVKCCVIYRGGYVPIWKWAIEVLTLIKQLMTVANGERCRWSRGSVRSF